MMRAAPETWTPIGIATRRVIERVVVHNPDFAPIWIKHDPTASDALARLGISPTGEKR